MEDQSATTSDVVKSVFAMECPLVVPGYSSVGCWKARRLAIVIRSVHPEAEALAAEKFSLLEPNIYLFWRAHDVEKNVLVYGSDYLHWLAVLAPVRVTSRGDHTDSDPNVQVNILMEQETPKRRFFRGVWDVGESEMLLPKEKPPSPPTGEAARGPMRLYVYGGNDWSKPPLEELAQFDVDPTCEMIVLPASKDSYSGGFHIRPPLDVMLPADFNSEFGNK